MTRTRTVLLGLLAGLLTTIPAWAETVTLRSGNGTIGDEDTEITMLVGPANSAFAESFDSDDFASARSGPSAWIIPPDGAWTSQLDSDASAQWIGTRDVTGPGVWGDSALFAMGFEISGGAIASATMDLFFLVDNDLGSALDVGIYFNELPVDGSSRRGASHSYFETEQSFLDLDVTDVLQSGWNTMYVYMVDHTGPSGLVFSASLDIQTVPLPTAALAGAAVLVFFGALRRKRSR